MEKVVVGIIGSGFAAHLHLTAYQFIYGVDVDVKAISSLSSDLKEVADQYHIRETYLDYNEMLKDQEIDVVDIIVPPVIHAQCVRDAMNAGKHVICEKPLTGYFGEEGDKEPIGLYVNREKMKNTVTLEMDELKEFIKNSGKKFMYAENWVYVPSVLKSAEIITAKKSKQLFLKAEESH